jgi:hypothetical protein
MDELAQASATNTQSALLTLGPDPVAYINIYNYQAESRQCEVVLHYQNTYFASKAQPVKN